MDKESFHQNVDVLIDTNLAPEEALPLIGELFAQLPTDAQRRILKGESKLTLLLTGSSSPTKNGLYDVTHTGTNSKPWRITRRTKA